MDSIAKFFFVLLGVYIYVSGRLKEKFLNRVHGRHSHRWGGVSMSIAVCYEDKGNKQRGVPSVRECHGVDAFNIVMQVTFVTEYK